MAGTGDAMAVIAERHGLSVGAVRALAQALHAGCGGGAQWSHPDLGGMGQWSGGSMLQIGDMFNDALKARVRATLEALAATERREAPDGVGQRGPVPPRGGWWPAEFGTPFSTGAQDATRYACFPDLNRLVVEQDGRTIVYDTGAHRLTGFAQAQGHGRSLAFSGPEGSVTVDELTVVG